MSSDPRRTPVGSTHRGGPASAGVGGQTSGSCAPRSIDLSSAVQLELDVYIARQREVLAELGPATQDLVDAVQSLTRGGKRLRASFLYWGYIAAGGSSSSAIVRAASAMELFQAAALLHDDVMDNSDIRRGRPTAHRHFAAQHDEQQWSGNAAHFGNAAAILAGDLALTWSDEVFSTAGLATDELDRGREIFDRMRTQLMGGQFLDIRESVRSWDALDHAARIDSCLRVIRYKSAKYSVEQPVLIGAAAAKATGHDLGQLSHYGLALGEAFQLRDDILGVFGDPETTGKPAGDDIREGKRTVIIAEALAAGTTEQVDVIHAALGDRDLEVGGVSAVREALIESGAVERTEARIQDGARAARAHLGQTTDLSDAGRSELDALIDVATQRST